MIHTTNPFSSTFTLGSTLSSNMHSNVNPLFYVDVNY